MWLDLRVSVDNISGLFPLFWADILYYSLLRLVLAGQFPFLHLRFNWPKRTAYLDTIALVPSDVFMNFLKFLQENRAPIMTCYKVDKQILCYSRTRRSTPQRRLNASMKRYAEKYLLLRDFNLVMIRRSWRRFTIDACDARIRSTIEQFAQNAALRLSLQGKFSPQRIRCDRIMRLRTRFPIGQ